MNVDQIIEQLTNGSQTNEKYGTEPFIKEAGLYCADDKGQPVDAYNHSMDEARYAYNHFAKSYGLWGQ